jgi:hypothetical protein
MRWQSHCYSAFHGVLFGFTITLPGECASSKFKRWEIEAVALCLDDGLIAGLEGIEVFAVCLDKQFTAECCRHDIAARQRSDVPLKFSMSSARWLQPPPVPPLRRPGVTRSRGQLGTGILKEPGFRFADGQTAVAPGRVIWPPPRSPQALAREPAANGERFDFAGGIQSHETTAISASRIFSNGSLAGGSVIPMENKLPVTLSSSSA